MTNSAKRKYFSNRLTSRAGAWVSIAVVLVAMTALFGLFGKATAPARTGTAPITSESHQVDVLLKEFPNSDVQSLLVVASREDAGKLTEADIAAVTNLIPVVTETATGKPMGPMVSEDGQAAIISVPITVGETASETAVTVENLRTDLVAVTPTGVVLEVTGGPAFGADIASAFKGANMTLLMVTILIVAILLIATYRSPVLWLVPLVVVALADGLAGRITAAAGQAWNLQFDAGIMSVLVFGAGTNYALLLISRYREELLTHEDHRAALSIAWRKSLPAILASNFTVVLSLLTLLFAIIPLTRGLGIPAAIGLLIALAFVLFALPPLLAVCGRGIFWPFVPRPEQSQAQGRFWRAIATRVSRRPVVNLLAGLALLTVMTAGLLGTSVGLTQLEKFRVASESADGLTTVSAHFAPGDAQPIYVVTNTDQQADVIAAAEDVTGFVRISPVATTPDNELTKISVISEYEPGSDRSEEQIVQLRDAVHAIDGADALVGGAVATDMDANAGNLRDLLVIAPMVLAVSFIVLLLLLRSLVAPVVLLAVNLASAVAAIGAGVWLSRVLFGRPALDSQVPILAFLFLVALGIDYTIFLVHRAKAEAVYVGTRQGMVEAVAHTGSVITSAGIVLAAVFAALGVLPLVTLGQLGLIVGVGVIVDTLVVRTVIVPALFSVLGDKMWWPGRGSQIPASSSSPAAEERPELATR